MKIVETASRKRGLVCFSGYLLWIQAILWEYGSLDHGKTSSLVRCYWMVFSHQCSPFSTQTYFGRFKAYAFTPRHGILHAVINPVIPTRMGHDIHYSQVLPGKRNEHNRKRSQRLIYSTFCWLFTEVILHRWLFFHHVGFAS